MNRRKTASRYPNTVSAYVPDKTYQELDVICTERNVSLSEFIREALKWYIASLS